MAALVTTRRLFGEVKKLNPDTGVEALTPDFLGLESAIDVLLESGLDVFAQNVETVKRLTHRFVTREQAMSKPSMY